MGIAMAKDPLDCIKRTIHKAVLIKKGNNRLECNDAELCTRLVLYCLPNHSCSGNHAPSTIPFVLPSDFSTKSNRT